jgi:hypothetical protein
MALWLQVWELAATRAGAWRAWRVDPAGAEAGAVGLRRRDRSEPGMVLPNDRQA